LTPEALVAGFAVCRYGESGATVLLIIPLLAMVERAGTSKTAATTPRILMLFIFLPFLTGFWFLFTVAIYAWNKKMSVRLGLFLPYDPVVHYGGRTFFLPAQISCNLARLMPQE
jgi:hypothetical protein